MTGFSEHGARSVAAGGPSESQPYVFSDSLRDPFDRDRRARIRAAASSDGPKTAARPRLQAVDQGPPPYAIDGLLWDEKKPTVVLRHTVTGDVRMLGKGESWDSLRVKDIRPDRVLLRYGRREFVLQ